MAKPGSHRDHSQQVHHDQIRQFKMGQQCEINSRAESDHRQSPKILKLAVFAWPRRKQGCGLRSGVPADDVNVDVAALPCQFIDIRASQQFFPARLLRLAYDNTGDIS